MKQHNNNKAYGRGYRWSLADDEYLKNNYANGNLEEICKFLGRNYNTVQCRARTLGLKRNKMLMAHNRSKQVLDKKLSKYFGNEQYFSSLNEESAYVLGFIITDGCIEVRKDRMVKSLSMALNLSSKDEYILYNINKSMQANFPIYKNLRRKMSALTIRNQKICNDLLDKWKVVPRKSLVVNCPNIEAPLIPHFLRGVIDGDGTIQKGKKPRIAIYSGSKKFTDGIIGLLGKLNVFPRIYLDKRSKNINYVIRINKIKDILALYDLMYSTNNDLYLTRKKEILDKVKHKYS